MLPLHLSLLPMEINVLTQTRRKHADPPAGFDLAAIVADVMDSGFRIPREPMGARRVGPVVKARRRNGHGKLVQTATFPIQFVAEIDDVLAFGVVHGGGCERLRKRLFPALVHLIGGFTTHAKKIDSRISRQRADDYRHVVSASLGVGYVFK